MEKWYDFLQRCVHVTFVVKLVPIYLEAFLKKVILTTIRQFDSRHNFSKTKKDNNSRLKWLEIAQSTDIYMSKPMTCILFELW